MEKGLKFNSQVCTRVEQSRRLLKLGLKPETADCYNRQDGYVFSNWIGKPSLPTDIPAWSLHRLLKMLPSKIKQIDCYYNLIFEKDIIQYEDYGIDVLKSFRNSPNIYDNIVDCIEWLIKEGYFNKEYLKQ